jgi:hypothetical protein
MNTTVKVYQENKSGKETFAITTEGANIANEVANALYLLGQTQKKWQAKKGIRFSGFALSKPVYFYANGKAFNAKISNSLKLRLKFKVELTLNDYKELVKDLLKVINL